MSTSETNGTVVEVTGLSNAEFLSQYGGPGRIGLSGGVTLVDRAIARAQRHLDADEVWSTWSHAFLFQGLRPDGHHWVIESDLQVHRKHIQLGVQENRVSKYHDEDLYTCLAVLDLQLSEKHINALLTEALDLVANRARYSIRELIGTLIALRHQSLRAKANLMSRERSMYCSAFVQHIFRRAGLELAPGVHAKNTTPEDIMRTALPHVTYVLKRKVLRKTARKLQVNTSRDAA